jgi:hypothetical protein
MNQRSEADPGTGSAEPGSAATSHVQIERMLDDLRTLLGYVARHGGGGMGGVGMGGADAAAPPPVRRGRRPPPVPPLPDRVLAACFTDGRIDPELLVRSASEIAADSRLQNHLYASVELLTDLAAPATVMSIRLTAAVLGWRPSGPSLSADMMMARRLVRWFTITGIIGLIVFLFLIVLLVHIDRGRREVQQLEAMRSTYQSALAAAANAKEPLITGDFGLARCVPPPTVPSGAAGNTTAAQYRTVCDGLDAAIVGMLVAYSELDRWNEVSGALSYLSPLNWTTPRSSAAAAGPSAAQLQSTEQRTTLMMAGLTGFVLPMLLGLLGACTYVYRDFDNALPAFTLKESDGIGAILRLVLGVILGGLTGLVWTNSQPIHLQGVTLSLGAVAFVVGFSVETVFRTLETMVVGVAERFGRSR